MDSKRTFTKIDEFTFKVEQTKHLEETVDTTKHLNQIAQMLNWLRECVNNANDMQDRFVKIAETYNWYIDFMQEAKDNCWFDYKLPEKIEIPECFDIIDVKIENIPTVDIKKDK